MPRLLLLLALLPLLADCSGGRYPSADLPRPPARFYPPPGPAGDPWGPYITEAASRFGLPPGWIRAVMRQESGGQQQAVSRVGAIGLMQLMPATYAALRDQYGLAEDPFAPRDNILAGTAYLKQMYDRFGAPGFLAAYNAGPQRLDRYLTAGDPLPAETVNYVAVLAPQLDGAALTGPLAVYAEHGATLAQLGPPTPRSLAAGCDADAAYDPAHPCRALERAAAAPVHAPPEQVAALGGWAIQVGAFTSPELARGMAERAREETPDLLAGAAVSTPTTSPLGGTVLYRARLVALSRTLAALACQRLNARQLPCIVVRPV